uniref:Uncharacterized protein n=1 Tax=Siphoviridae sp. ct6rT12 TaxID=2825346 RepID=A0A8S5V9N1_9CAUD|nr:MAG TPA: hypothetical protein [Siphoviridae sp. ct6rT12]
MLFLCYPSFLLSFYKLLVLYSHLPAPPSRKNKKMGYIKS